MIKINEIKDYKFKVTWKLLYLGFRGNDLFINQFSAKDIINHAIEQLTDENNDDLLCELASENESNVDNINSLLKKLSIRETSKESIELKKITFYISIS